MPTSSNNLDPGSVCQGGGRPGVGSKCAEKGRDPGSRIQACAREGPIGSRCVWGGGGPHLPLPADPAPTLWRRWLCCFHACLPLGAAPPASSAGTTSRLPGLGRLGRGRGRWHERSGKGEETDTLLLASVTAQSDVACGVVWCGVALWCKAFAHMNLCLTELVSMCAMAMAKIYRRDPWDGACHACEGSSVLELIARGQPRYTIPRHAMPCA